MLDLSNIKQTLISDPEHIVNLLELYEFHHIKVRNNEIRCAFEEGGNPTSIVIRLNDNEELYVKDYGRNLSCDLIDYFIKTRGATFKQVLNDLKKELGITHIENVPKAHRCFDMFLSRMHFNENEPRITIYDEDILDQYENLPNVKFYKDGISFDTQRKFQIGFDIRSQRITIPIRSPGGDLIGVKGRCNYTPEEGEPKYMYLTDSCVPSATLYGYYENYQNLLNNTVIVLESEKSVMQLDSMGCSRGLGLGSNSLSLEQAKLINRLRPKSVIFALDNSLKLDITAQNAKTLLSCCFLQEYPIYYFDWRTCTTLNEKDSPTDHGKDIFNQIISNNLRPIQTLFDEESRTKTTEDPLYNLFLGSKLMKEGA